MKNFKFLGIAFLAFSFLLTTACNNDDDGDGIGLNGDCFASWTVDGTDYSSENMVGCLYFDNALNLSSQITTGGDFFMQIDPITSSGTYVADVNNQDLSVVMFLMLNDGRTIAINDGTVNVTEISSSKAKGTFSGNFFDLTDINLDPVFSVTNGTFEANF